jgi:Cu/Ag efflux protein CusF
MFEARCKGCAQGKEVSMGKMLGLFAAVGILGAAAAAFAGDATYRTTGKIKSVDLMNHVVTLQNGSAYKAARGVNIKGLKAGQKVTLTYSGFGGSIEASAIKPAVD